MPLKVAIQMDPPESINIEKDSTFVMGLEAQKRGHELFYYSPQSLTLQNKTVTASCAPLKFRRKKGAHCALGEFQEIDLTSFDIILMRQDNEDPQGYSAITHILDFVTHKTLVVNDPAGTREAPEKLFILQYPELAPPTLITRNVDDIRAFQKKHPELIIKPLNGFGGMDIYHLKEDDDNLQAVYEMLCKLHTEPFVVQKYLPEIKQGDKRIIAVEGEPLGAILRIPPEKSARANLAVGGKAVQAEITDRDREICAILKPELIKRGLSFVGIDVIGDYVTEVNPKSPTGLQQIYKFTGIKCEEAIWDAYETRLKNRKKAA